MTFQRRDILSGFSALTLVLGATGCASTSATSALPNWQHLFSQGAMQVTGQEVARLKRIGDRVLRSPQSGLARHYGVSLDARPMAFMTTGDGVVVSQGLLALCETDGNLAAIIAQRVALSFDGPNSDSRHSLALPLNEPISSLSELEVISRADTIALSSLARSGYDPRDLAEIWQRIGTTKPDTNHATRILAIYAQLRSLGYQV